MKERNRCSPAFYDYSKLACHKVTGTRSINDRCLLPEFKSTVSRVATGDVLYNTQAGGGEQTLVSCLIVTLPIWFILNKATLSNLQSERNQLTFCCRELCLSLKWNLRVWLQSSLTTSGSLSSHPIVQQLLLRCFQTFK